MSNLDASPALTEGRTCSLEAHTAHEAPPLAPQTGSRLLLARRADERLVELVRQGDAAAFEVLYDRYNLRILSFCRHMLGSQQDGEDATQHAFVALHRHIVGDDRPVDVKPWLFQVARNRCLSIIRSRREHADVDDPVLQPATEGLADSVQRRSDLRELLGDLHHLPDDQRAALLLSSLGDLSGDQIAEVIGCRPQKVKALVFQARTSLMNERDARNTDCAEVREQLATLRGGALLRGPLRRHVRHCDGCRAYRDATRKQREALALLLPVIPTAGLKAATMSTALGGGAAAAAGGAAATATGGGIAAGLAAGGKAGFAKLVVAAAVASGGIGAGVVEVHHLATKGAGEGNVPAVQHERNSGHSTAAPGTTSVATTPLGTANTKHPTGKGHNGHHGKPTSSPAQSPNAATGKGIAGTQPGHGSGTTGKAGAPGQLKPHPPKPARTHVKARGRLLHKPATKPAPTAPVHPDKPAEPAKPETSGQTQQPTTTTDAVTTTEQSVTTGAINGASQK
jgi:RNA polymerase sigma factor (sigma-70 family)